MKLRELLALARERLGDKAADLKTRDELEAALFGATVPTPSPVAEVESPTNRVVITKDFFTTPP